MRAPTIRDARELAKRMNARAVLVVTFGDHPEKAGSATVAGASYGETKPECTAAGRILDDVIEDAMSGRWLTGIFQSRVP